MAKRSTRKTGSITPLEKDADAVARRLHFLVKDRPQAEISRRTNTPVANVNRYLYGTKVPAEFCAGLVRHFGVNPAWLLMGEGTPYLSDVTADRSGQASDLLGLVDAMNRVTKMRLGALVGKDHLKVLRQLNDTLETYEALRDRMNQQSKPIIGQLLEDYRSSLDAKRFKRESAMQIRVALEQVLRLCDDDELRLEYEGLVSLHEWQLGNVNQALLHAREVLNKKLLAVTDPDSQFLVAATNYVIALHDTMQSREARRVCRAILRIAEQVSHLPEYIYLQFYEGQIDVTLGYITVGLQRMLGAYSRLPHDSHQNIYTTHFVVNALLKSGAMSVSSAMNFGAPIAHKASTILSFACWQEDLGDLHKAYDAYSDKLDWSGERYPILLVYARSLMQALKSPSKRILKSFENEPTVRALEGKLGLSYRVCRLAMLAGDRARALREFKRTETILAETLPELNVSFVITASHHRSALEIIPENTRSAELREYRQRAQEFINEHYLKGFGCLKRYATVT